jgi:hypothetical protein
MAVRRVCGKSWFCDSWNYRSTRSSVRGQDRTNCSVDLRVTELLGYRRPTLKVVQVRGLSSHFRPRCARLRRAPVCHGLTVTVYHGA